MIRGGCFLGVGTGCAERPRQPLGGWEVLKPAGESGTMSLLQCLSSKVLLLFKCDEALRNYADPSLDIKAWRVVFLIANTSSGFFWEKISHLSGHFVSEGTLRCRSS